MKNIYDPMLIFEMTRYRFCGSCGKKLVPKKPEILRYDGFDGKPIIRYKIECPDYYKIFTIGMHTSITKDYDGESMVTFPYGDYERVGDG